MDNSRPDVRQHIHAKVIEIARSLGRDARGLKNNQEIPASGFIDSAGIMELIMWFEGEYGLAIPQEELTLDNFGTIDAMAGYLQKSGSAAG